MHLRNAKLNNPKPLIIKSPMGQNHHTTLNFINMDI